MIRQELAVYSLRNIAKKKSRTFLTILSIFIGITTIFIFISFGLGLYNYINDLQSSSSADKIVIQPKGIGAPGLDETFALTEDDVKAVEKSTGVYESTGIYTQAAEVKRDDAIKYVWAMGYDPEKPLVLEFLDIGVYRGRELRPGDRGKVVLGYNYQIDDKIFPRAYSLNGNIEIQGQKYKIVGFYNAVGNPQDDSNIYFTSDDFKGLYNSSKGFSMIIARADVNQLSNSIKSIESNLRKSRNLDKGEEDFFVQSFDDLIETYSNALNIVIIFILLIALISVVVSAINTSNTMITSVLERVKEIGVIKSIGSRNYEVFSIFLFESGFLGFMAGIIGVILGFIISFTAGAILKSIGWGFLQPDYPWYLFIALIAFATLTGAVSGAWPAWNASRIRPVEALRYE